MKLFAPLALLLSLLTLALTPSRASAATGKAGCEALKGAAFATVMDAPTSVMKAAYVEAKDGLPAYCAIEGYVSRNNGFVLWLPATYEGRFLARGCGGFCGIADGAFTCTDELRIGYACLQTDMGHKSGISDGAWAYQNTEAEIDFGSRSTHVTTLAGKAIAAAYYAKPPAWSYFLGCSTGGRQALVEAQRFPEDFQGIVAVAPALNETGASVQLTWSLQANRAGGHNILSPDKLAMVHRAVVEACDMNDGLKDGLIGDPKRCAFKLDGIACKGAASATCLTPDEAGVIAKIWAGPSNKAGRLFPTGGAPMGSEGHWGQAYIGAGDAWGANTTLLTEFWRYLGFEDDPGPTWTLDRFDFDRDPPRTGAKEAIYSGGDVDLRQFKQGGGKLLLLHGLTDDNVVPGGTLDYYQGVTRFMGGPEQTRPFARLFQVPGMNHCTGGEGPYAIDTLSALAAWVETGVAPERLEARRPKDGVTVPYLGIGLALTPEQTALRRPVFAWPAEAIYAGKGDPDDLNSWKAR